MAMHVFKQIRVSENIWVVKYWGNETCCFLSVGKGSQNKTAPEDRNNSKYSRLQNMMYITMMMILNDGDDDDDDNKTTTLSSPTTTMCI